MSLWVKYAWPSSEKWKKIKKAVNSDEDDGSCFEE